MNFTAGKRQQVRKIILAAVIFISFIILLSFLFRNILFNYYLDRYINRFNKAFKAELKIDKAKIRGFSSLEVDGIILKPQQGDTLLKIDSVYATVSFWKMITGRLALNNFILANTRLSFVKKDSCTNYMFLLDKKSARKQSTDTISVKNYASRMKSIMDAVFEKNQTIFLSGISISVLTTKIIY
ncbi:MAG: hypothetical protein AB9842_14045 [Bacteroidales bacterium]